MLRSGLAGSVLNSMRLTGFGVTGRGRGEGREGMGSVEGWWKQRQRQTQRGIREIEDEDDAARLPAG